MVEARLLSEFRGSKVSLQGLRPCLDLLRQEFARYPLAHAQTFLTADGREVVHGIQDEVGLEPSL